PAVRDGLWRFFGKGNFCGDLYLARACQLHVSLAGSNVVHLKLDGMGIAVGHIRSAGPQSLAPGRVVERNATEGVPYSTIAEFYVHAPLADARAAHARKIGFAAGLKGKAAVEDVIPRIPFLDAAGVHRTDEVAYALRYAHGQLHGADAVHFGNRIV